MNHSAAKFIALCIGIAIFTSAPIWGVQYFINADGSAHVQSSWMMLELLRGDPRVSSLYEFNLLTFPNVTGHWIQAISLLVVSPFTSTKLMLSLTFLALAASVVVLRWCTCGGDGLGISVLVGVVVAFNWLWLVGAYNYILGFSLAIAGTGLFWKWRTELTAGRMAVLAALAVLAFLSHIIGFLFLAAAIFSIAVFSRERLSRSSIVRTAIILLPTLPLLILYAASTEAGGSFSPLWRSLSDPLSITAWITQIRSADSLFLLRRTAFPFVESESVFFSVFASLPWLAGALGVLIFRTLKQRGLGEMLPFAILSIGFIVFSLISPDDIQYSSSQGGLMRQRFFMAGIAFIVPIFRVEDLARVGRFIVIAVLSFMVAFQTSALWEYALRSDRDAREFFTVTDSIPEGTAMASIIIEPRTYRFAAAHMGSINCYNAIFRSATEWDNYEFANYLFPLVTRSPKHQKFVVLVGISNTYDLSTPGSVSGERIAVLDHWLASQDPRIDTLVVWGSYEPVDSVIASRFAGPPVFEHGRGKVFVRER